jgi:hypothetical protein
LPRALLSIPRVFPPPAPPAGFATQSGIETMSHLEQVYLFERDTGLLCRLLGLYASH